MTATRKKSPTTTKSSKKGKAPPSVASQKAKAARARERVLVEFPVSLLKRTDQAAIQLEKNRSELIRTAVEQLLEEIEKKAFEIELATAYAANAQMNRKLAEEFSHVDREGF